MMGLAAFAVVAIAGGALFASTRDGSLPQRTRVGDRMVPLVSTHDTTVTMPITLPDGRRVIVSYPSAIDVAGLGVRIQTTVDWPASFVGAGDLQCCHREVNLSYGTVADLYPNAIAAAVYPGAHGSKVLLFHASQRRAPPVPYANADQLVFQFGRWVAEVWTSVPGAEDRIEPLTEQQQAVWATNLRAETRKDGFVVLQPQAPLQPGAPNAVFVYFGDDPIRGGTGTGLMLSPFYCGRPESPTEHRTTRTDPDGTTVVWCDPATGFAVDARGPTTFTTSIAIGLELHAAPTG
jgi:hypothetical protein